MERLRQFNPLHDRFGYPSLIGIGITSFVIGVLLQTSVVSEFILNLLGAVGILVGIVIATAGLAAFASEKGWLNRSVESMGRVGDFMEILRRFNPLHDRFGDRALIGIGIVVLVVGILVQTGVVSNVLVLILELIGWVGILGGIAISVAGTVALLKERGTSNIPVESTGQAEQGLNGSTDSSVQAEQVLTGPAESTGQVEQGRPRIRGLLTAVLFAGVLLSFFLPWMSVYADGELEFAMSGKDGIFDQSIREIRGYETGDMFFVSATAVLALIGLIVSPAIGGRWGRFVRAIIGVFGMVAMGLVYLSLLSFVDDVMNGGAGIAVQGGGGCWLAFLGFFAVLVLQSVPMPFPETQTPRGA